MSDDLDRELDELLRESAATCPTCGAPAGSCKHTTIHTCLVCGGVTEHVIGCPGLDEAR